MIEIEANIKEYESLVKFANVKEEKNASKWLGAIHFIKNSGIFDSEVNRTVISGKFISKILVNLSRLSIFPKYWN